MIPQPVAILGLLGLTPFLAGASLARWPVAHPLLAALADGNRMLVHYGVIILCFLSGALWGFATRAEGREAWVAYILATIPALWAFLALAPGHPYPLLALIAGYTVLLALDFWFWNEGLAPAWWMRLRLMLTIGVLASLSVAL